jgi:hypothetical protein
LRSGVPLSVSVLIITEISSGFFAVHCEVRILHAILSGLLRGLLLVSQSAIQAPFHSHLARIVIVAKRVTANLLGTSAMAARAANFQVSRFTISKISTRDPSTRRIASMCEVSRSSVLLATTNRIRLDSVALDVPRARMQSAWQPIDRLHALHCNWQLRR